MKSRLSSFLVGDTHPSDTRLRNRDRRQRFGTSHRERFRQSNTNRRFGTNDQSSDLQSEGTGTNMLPLSAVRQRFGSSDQASSLSQSQRDVLPSKARPNRPESSAHSRISANDLPASTSHSDQNNPAIIHEHNVPTSPHIDRHNPSSVSGNEVQGPLSNADSHSLPTHSDVLPHITEFSQSNPESRTNLGNLIAVVAQNVRETLSQLDVQSGNAIVGAQTNNEGHMHVHTTQTEPDPNAGHNGHGTHASHSTQHLSSSQSIPVAHVSHGSHVRHQPHDVHKSLSNPNVHAGHGSHASHQQHDAHTRQSTPNVHAGHGSHGAHADQQTHNAQPDRSVPNSHDTHASHVARGSHKTSHAGQNHADMVCDRGGEFIKDETGKIVQILDYHDCTPLDVVWDPITGGHAIDPHTKEFLFAIESRSFLSSPSETVQSNKVKDVPLIDASGTSPDMPRVVDVSSQVATGNSDILLPEIVDISSQVGPAHPTQETTVDISSQVAEGNIPDFSPQWFFHPDQMAPLGFSNENVNGRDPSHSLILPIHTVGSNIGQHSDQKQRSSDFTIGIIDPNQPHDHQSRHATENIHRHEQPLVNQPKHPSEIIHNHGQSDKEPSPVVIPSFENPNPQPGHAENVHMHQHSSIDTKPADLPRHHQSEPREHIHPHDHGIPDFIQGTTHLGPPVNTHPVPGTGNLQKHEHRSPDFLQGVIPPDPPVDTQPVPGTENIHAHRHGRPDFISVSVPQGPPVDTQPLPGTGNVHTHTHNSADLPHSDIHNTHSVESQTGHVGDKISTHELSVPESAPGVLTAEQAIDPHSGHATENVHKTTDTTGGVIHTTNAGGHVGVNIPHPETKILNQVDHSQPTDSRLHNSVVKQNEVNTNVAPRKDTSLNSGSISSSNTIDKSQSTSKKILKPNKKTAAKVNKSKKQKEPVKQNLKPNKKAAAKTNQSKRQKEALKRKRERQERKKRRRKQRQEKRRSRRMRMQRKLNKLQNFLGIPRLSRNPIRIGGVTNKRKPRPQKTPQPQQQPKQDKTPKQTSKPKSNKQKTNGNRRRGQRIARPLQRNQNRRGNRRSPKPKKKCSLSRTMKKVLRKMRRFGINPPWGRGC